MEEGDIEKQSSTPEEGQTKQEVKQEYMDWSLGGISFLESAFLPVITDPFLLAMTIARPHLWIRYTVIAGITSVLGGLFGYFLGSVFFELVGAQIIAFYGAEQTFEKIATSLGDNAFVFTLIGAFTPVPYKLVAIVGGTLHINLLIFVIASIVGRFARFTLVAFISAKFGEYALKQFNKRFKLVTIAVIGGVLLYLAMVLF